MHFDISEKERRKEKRYRVVNGAYAVMGSKPSILGQIKDVSGHGLAFKYLADGAGRNGARQMDVFVRNNNFHMKDIPIRTVYDIELAKEDPCSTVVLRQQSVQFGALTEKQADQLKHLLQHHTLGEI